MIRIRACRLESFNVECIIELGFAKTIGFIPTTSLQTPNLIDFN